MIIIAIGSNLPSGTFGSATKNCEMSLIFLGRSGINILDQSSWYKTVPIPTSTQPNFINGVVSVKTDLGCEALLNALLEIETKMGRERSIQDAARIIDLDLIVYNDEIIESEKLTLPHPRLAERAFVAQPIAEIAPDWCHPVSNASISDILSKLTEQEITRISA